MAEENAVGASPMIIAAARQVPKDVADGSAALTAADGSANT
jgi:hypothetical protein